MTEKKWFADRCRQVEPATIVAFGVVLESRWGSANDLLEMLEFAQHLAETMTEMFVISVCYDSLGGVAVINLSDDHPTTAQQRNSIFLSARAALSSFSIPGYVGETLGRHNVPPACSKGSYPAEVISDNCTREFAGIISCDSMQLKNPECISQDFIDGVREVLSDLDRLAVVWGDEGVFRRCRDRLRALLPAEDELTRGNCRLAFEEEEGSF